MVTELEVSNMESLHWCLHPMSCMGGYIAIATVMIHFADLLATHWGHAMNMYSYMHAF